MTTESQCFTHRGDSTRLLAARSRDGRYWFPRPGGREAEAYEPVELGPLGTLWSFTIQRFRPKPPFDGRGTAEDFRPFAVGYVEFPGQLIVEGRLLVEDFRVLEIGMPMILTTEAYREDAAGRPVHTFAFVPAGSAGPPAGSGGPPS